MKKQKISFVVIFMAIFFLSSCTENQKARAFGGSASIKLKCDQKLFDLTWKKESLWYVVKKMKENEESETYFFREDSSFGLLEDTVTITESKCKKK